MYLKAFPPSHPVIKSASLSAVIQRILYVKLHRPGHLSEAVLRAAVVRGANWEVPFDSS